LECSINVYLPVLCHSAASAHSSHPTSGVCICGVNPSTLEHHLLDCLPLELERYKRQRIGKVYITMPPFIVSGALPVVLENLVLKILNGEFVDIAELLRGNK